MYHNLALFRIDKNNNKTNADAQNIEVPIHQSRKWTVRSRPPLGKSIRFQRHRSYLEYSSGDTEENSWLTSKAWKTWRQRRNVLRHGKTTLNGVEPLKKAHREWGKKEAKSTIYNNIQIHICKYEYTDRHISIFDKTIPLRSLYDWYVYSPISHYIDRPRHHCAAIRNSMCGRAVLPHYSSRFS